MGSMDSSKPKVLLLFLQSFTAPKTPLAAANLAVLGRKQPLCVLQGLGVPPKSTV